MVALLYFLFAVFIFCGALGTRATPLVRRDLPYQLEDTYQGYSFFDGFNFFSNSDPTNGQVNYLGQGAAWDAHLVSVTPDVATIRVDNQTWLDLGAKRNSVRVESRRTYSSGLFIFDVQHMPVGQSLWPALWTIGQGDWPTGGEVDVVEGVNLQTTNHMAFHTSPGCYLDTSAYFSGTADNTNCDANDDESEKIMQENSNQGCGITSPPGNSYGASLNAAGGSLFVMEFEPYSGIKIWRFPRTQIPSDIISGNPDPSRWWAPEATLSSSTCPTRKYFKAQRIIINITICGDWAGNAYSGSGTCASVLTDPGNYWDALWQIRSIKTYQKGGVQSGSEHSAASRERRRRAETVSATVATALAVVVLNLI